jgi:prepilin-type N-terminal cleavage/methylation domain-containing protein
MVRDLAMRLICFRMRKSLSKKLSTWMFFKSMRGVTLLELVVVVAIVGIFSSISAVTYSSTEKQRKVTLAAQQIQADVRYVQNLALSFKKHNGKFARGGYGIRFLHNASLYTIFADLDCFGGSDCSVSSNQFATGGTSTSLIDGDVSPVWTADQWKGGNIFIRAGKCGGNVRFVSSNTANTISIPASKPFKDTNGVDCIPDVTSEYMVFGNARFDSAAGERLEDKGVDGAQILVPSSSYDIVFSPPTPEIKANQTLISGGARVTITVSSGAFTKFVDIYANGFVEIR